MNGCWLTWGGGCDRSQSTGTARAPTLRLPAPPTAPGQDRAKCPVQKQGLRSLNSQPPALGPTTHLVPLVWLVRPLRDRSRSRFPLTEQTRSLKKHNQSPTALSLKRQPYPFPWSFKGDAEGHCGRGRAGSGTAGPTHRRPRLCPSMVTRRDARQHGSDRCRPWQFPLRTPRLPYL